MSPLFKFALFLLFVVIATTMICNHVRASIEMVNVV